MSPDVIALHPEVEEILLELSRRPGSALLRVPRKAIERTLLERQTLVSPLSSCLDGAERHLVQAHREELAWVLRQAAWVKLATGESTRLFVQRRIHVDEEIPVPEVREVRQRASQALRSDVQGGEPKDALELLERCVSADGIERWASAAQLAAAAVRLVPADQPRLNAGLDLAIAGHGRTAARITAGVARSHPERDLAAAAWCNLAFISRGSGQLPVALACARRAIDAMPECFQAHLNLLWYAIADRDERTAVDSARTLAQMLGSRTELADELGRIHSARMRMGVMELDGRGWDMFRRLSPVLGPLAERIVADGSSR